MSNYVMYYARSDIPALFMSNGGTSAFIAVLSLSASALATNDRERELAIWFASHDQSVYGLGMVGVDISDLPWRSESFAQDRAFLLRVIDAAKAKTGWERLGYNPDVEWLTRCLDKFRAMVEAFDVTDAADREEAEWRYRQKPNTLELCPTHRVYRHVEGCLICNDS